MFKGEGFDYPEVFFEEKIHAIRRVYPDQNQLKNAADVLISSKQPIIIAGGGVLYSEAEKELSEFAKKHNIPVTPTVMGLGCMEQGRPLQYRTYWLPWCGIIQQLVKRH